jgi:nucleotide-binding universal stress UspA family protein
MQGGDTDSPDVAPARDSLDEILTLSEAEKISGISAHTFAQQAEKGRLHARKVGHTWITTLGWLKTYLLLHARRKRGERSEPANAADSLLLTGDQHGPIAGAIVSTAEPERAVGTVRAGDADGWHNGPRRILVGVDGSPESTTACWSAIALARQVGASLTLLHVAQPHVLRSSFDSAPQWREAQETARARGEQIVEEARSLCGDDVPCTTQVAFGEPSATICRRARELDADLIVVGSRGLGTIKRLVLGSVSTAVSNRAPCSVLVVRERTRGQSGRSTSSRASPAE